MHVHEAPWPSTLHAADCKCDHCVHVRVDVRIALSRAADTIRSRIAVVYGMIERRKAYRQDCITDEDEHGCWDAAVNIAEFKSEIAGLRFALELLA